MNIQSTKSIKTFALILMLLCNYKLSLAQTPNYKVLSIENNDDFSSFSMLDSVVNNYRLFFTGENHTFRKSNYMLQLKMMRYLHQTAGVRHLFIEFGYSRAWLVNKYIQTGDTTLFQTIHNYSYDEYTLLYKGLYEFNKSLDSANKIKISGIDLERSVPSAIKVMSLLLPKEDPPQSIAVQIDALRAIAIYIDKRQKAKHSESFDDDDYSTIHYSENASLKYILQDFDSNTVIYRDYLKENFADFERIVRGLQAETIRKKYSGSTAVQQYIFREQFMFEQLTALMERYPNDKFYSQFGRCHTALETEDVWCGYYFFRTLSSRMNASENTMLKGKVLSIACYYPKAAGNERGVTGAKQLDKLTPFAKENELTLFKVENDSNYFDDFIDKFQYIIINQNHPLKDRAKVDSSYEEKDNYSSKIEQLILTAHATYQYNNLSALNRAVDFGLADTKGFTDMNLWFGGEFQYNFIGDGSFSFLFDKRITERIFNGTSTLKLDAWAIKMRMGPDFSAKPWLLLHPFAGIGFSKFKITETTETINSTALPVFITNYNIEIVKNPAVVYELGLDIKINLGCFTLGINGGGQLDFSRKKWMYNGRYQSNSPRTSLSGYYFGATFGFNFPTF